jgi:hypothetical protein
MVIGMGAAMIAGMLNGRYAFHLRDSFDAGVELKSIGYPTPLPKDPSKEAILHDIEPAIVIAQKVRDMVAPSSTPAELNILQVEFAVTLMLVTAYTLIKLSIILFLRRLFVTHKTTIFSHFTWMLAAINIGWGIAFFFSEAFGCGSNFQAHWGSRVDLMEYCKNSLNREMGLYISEFIINITLIIAPIPIVSRPRNQDGDDRSHSQIWKLHMSTARKIAISALMLIGLMYVFYRSL